MSTDRGGADAVADPDDPAVDDRQTPCGECRIEATDEFGLGNGAGADGSGDASADEELRALTNGFRGHSGARFSPTSGTAASFGDRRLR